MEAKLVAIGVEGMTCSSCAQSIEQHLEKMDGIHNIQVSDPSTAPSKGLDEKPWEIVLWERKITLCFLAGWYWRCAGVFLVNKSKTGAGFTAEGVKSLLLLIDFLLYN